MFLVPIDSDATRRGHVPWFTFAVIAACLAIHARYGAVYERHEELMVELATRATTPDRFDRRGALEEELERVRQDDLISRWAFDPAGASLDDVLGAGAGMLTHAFVHGSWFHVLSNMLMLYLLGVPLERRFGLKRASSLYVSGALAGALGYWALHQSSALPMVGASGAVSAMMGAFLVFFHRSKLTLFYVILIVVYPWWGTFRAPAALFLPLWIGLELLQVFLESGGLSPVAHSAHVAGFAAGSIVALVWKLPILGGDVLGQEGDSAALRTKRLRDLRGLLTANPRDLALRSELVELAMELDDSAILTREVGPLLLGLEHDPARLVAAYRRVRERQPALPLPAPVLAAVANAAGAAGDHTVVIESVQRRMALERDAVTQELLAAMSTAASSQDALGHSALAAQTRSFLWSLGVRPPVADAIAPAVPTALPAPSQAEPPLPRASVADASAAPVNRAGRRTCASHGLVAVGTCSQCQVPVCAACSKAQGGARLCRECHVHIAAARGELRSAEANLHAFGVLWQIWGVLLVAMAPLLLLLPPDYAFGLDWAAALSVLLMAVAFLAFGRALARLRPWAFWPAVVTAVLLLFQVPVGTVIGALALTSLLRARGRRVLGGEYSRLRDLSPELDPRLSGFTRQLLGWTFAAFVLGVLGGYTLLVAKRAQARHVPPAELIQASVFRSWPKGHAFRLHVTRVSTASAGAGKERRSETRLELMGSGEVRETDERGWPRAVSYHIDRITYERFGRTTTCRDGTVVVRSTDEIVQIACDARQIDFEPALLLPRRPEVDDAALFHIESGQVTPGMTWQADEAKLDEHSASLLQVTGSTKPKPLRGTLSVTRREACGWPTCLVLDKSVHGELVKGTGVRTSVHGKFELTTRDYVPARPELRSFATTETIVIERDNTSSTETRREVVVDGENVTFVAAPLAFTEPPRPDERSE